MAQDYGYAPAQGLGRRAPPAPAPVMTQRPGPQPGPQLGAPPAAGSAADPRDAITQALMQIQNPPPTLPQQRTLPGAPMPNAPRPPGMSTQPNLPPTGMPPGMMQQGMPQGMPAPGAPGMPPQMGLGAAAPGGLVQGELAPTRPNPYA
jgi:hypothetical protein